MLLGTQNCLGKLASRTLATNALALGPRGQGCTILGHHARCDVACVCSVRTVPLRMLCEPDGVPEA
jgi:hypothetical protein